MSFPVVTLRDMMVQAANSAGVAYAPVDTPSIDELSTSNKSKYVGYINTSMDRLWRNPNPAFAWKWTTTSGLLTVQSGGFINWADIQFSEDWFCLFSQDPRPPNNPPNNNGWYCGNSAYPVTCVEDVQAIWPRTSLQTVYGFWRLPVPKFTSNLVSTTTTYNTIGTLVWDELGTGSVFKSIATAALGSNLLDTGKWLQVDIPYRLANVMAEMVETMRLQGTGADGSSKMNDAEMQTWLDTEMAKDNPRDGSGPVWGYDRRFSSYCRGYNRGGNW